MLIIHEFSVCGYFFFFLKIFFASRSLYFSQWRETVKCGRGRMGKTCSKGLQAGGSMLRPLQEDGSPCTWAARLNHRATQRSRSVCSLHLVWQDPNEKEGKKNYNFSQNRNNLYFSSILQKRNERYNITLTN